MNPELYILAGEIKSLRAALQAAKAEASSAAAAAAAAAMTASVGGGVSAHGSRGGGGKDLAVSIGPSGGGAYTNKKNEDMVGFGEMVRVPSGLTRNLLSFPNILHNRQRELNARR